MVAGMMNVCGGAIPNTTMKFLLHSRLSGIFDVVISTYYRKQNGTFQLTVCHLEGELFPSRSVTDRPS